MKTKDNFVYVLAKGTKESFRFFSRASLSADTTVSTQILIKNGKNSKKRNSKKKVKELESKIN
ncbi:hypothetical protein [Flavivirga sp. 57AJ16]|uniref:hypothetical protein n=1 Tax=Flavivirga sp. 57AJ16 TaxID=3025307 RepID=UPI0023657E57|nr:hypothetical protein [Flavivirga sp. 57AJ16]MDD7887713.1 hypothetical protein [Flavivirga sp. 57AJ16]